MRDVVCLLMASMLMPLDRAAISSSEAVGEVKNVGC